MREILAYRAELRFMTMGTIPIRAHNRFAVGADFVGDAHGAQGANLGGSLTFPGQPFHVGFRQQGTGHAADL